MRHSVLPSSSRTRACQTSASDMACPKAFCKLFLSALSPVICPCKLFLSALSPVICFCKCCTSRSFDACNAAISDLRFAGTSTDSDALGGVAAANYLRSNANDTTSGTLGVVNDTGLTVGADSDIKISVDTTGGIIQNQVADTDITFKITITINTHHIFKIIFFYFFDDFFR